LPGFLKAATGAAVHDFDPQIEQKQEIVMSDGTHYPAEVWYDILTPDTAETLATYTNRYYKGQAAITKNHFGKGTTYYVGTKTSSEEFYQKIMSAALTGVGIKPGQLVPYGVQVASREKAGKKIYFVLNYEDKTKTVPMGEKLVNAFTGKQESESVEIGPFDVKILTAQ
jgi:beta-galactosidase